MTRLNTPVLPMDASSSSNEPIAFENPRTRRSLFLLMLLGTAILYAQGLSIGYYGDDFQYIFARPGEMIWRIFVEPNPAHAWYRPLSSALIAATQALVGWETWPIHAVNILLHALLAWLVVRFLQREGFSLPYQVAAALVMIASQANAAAILQTDTTSQIAGTYFGCLTLWLLYRDASEDRSDARHSIPSRVHWGALATFALSLLSKESSLGFLPMIGVLFVAAERHNQPWKQRLVRALVATLPYAAIVGFYFALRAAIGIPTTLQVDEYRTVRLGPNVLVNIAQLAFAAVIPTSTVTGYFTLTSGTVLEKVLLILATGAVVGVAGYGLWHCREHRRVLGVAALFALMGMFPTAMINRVSELYVYNSFPFFAVLLGVGFGRTWELIRSRRALVILFSIGAFVLGLSHIVAISQKASLAYLNGIRARGLLEQLVRYAESAPPNTAIVLLRQVEQEDRRLKLYRLLEPRPFQAGLSVWSIGYPKYSVYVLDDYSLLAGNPYLLGIITSRTDVRLIIPDSLSAADATGGTHRMLLTIRDGAIVPLDPVQ
ncbi:MAG: hypothetical protein KatS3mg038_2491 [Candidatus Kapaibacterium sp.]|nr:MAG: hypothetical protein KatS3mg038_2491 [Candidatus Kapabacteria bacterium]